MILKLKLENLKVLPKIIKYYFKMDHNHNHNGDSSQDNGNKEHSMSMVLKLFFLQLNVGINVTKQISCFFFDILDCLQSLLSSVEFFCRKRSLIYCLGDIDFKLWNIFFDPLNSLPGHFLWTF